MYLRFGVYCDFSENICQFLPHPALYVASLSSAWLLWALACLLVFDNMIIYAWFFTLHLISLIHCKLKVYNLLFSHCQVFCDLPAWITDSIYIGGVHIALINLKGLFVASIILYLEWLFPCPHHENRSLEVPVYLFDYLHVSVQSLRDLLGETHEKMLHIFSLQQLFRNFPAPLVDAPSFPC